MWQSVDFVCVRGGGFMFPTASVAEFTQHCPLVWCVCACVWQQCFVVWCLL